MTSKVEVLVIKAADFQALQKTWQSLRDDTLKWPNSFGHGYNVGRLGAFAELREIGTFTQQ